MARFDVYRNANKATREAFPYLLDVQADLFSGLQSHVVVPLMRATTVRTPLARLSPAFVIEGKPVLMATTDMAGIPISALGEPVTNLADKRVEIVGAIDFLLTGA